MSFGKRRFSYCALLSVAVLLGLAEDACAFAEIEIFKVTQKFVCGGKDYSEFEECPKFTKNKFKKVKKSWRVQYEKAPPTDQSFKNDVVGDSRWEAGHGTVKYSALIAIKWTKETPASIIIRRTRADDGLNLSKKGPYRNKLARGLFFYHFTYDQIGKMRLEMDTKNPAVSISFEN